MTNHDVMSARRKPLRASRLRTLIWGIVMVAICCALIQAACLRESEKRLVPRASEQPLSPDPIKALAAIGANVVVTTDACV
jgi:hypothetical protein